MTRDRARALAHDELRRALGAYTLGALDPAERADIEAHLARCQACREELAQFAGLSGLLARLSADEAAAGLTAADTGAPERAFVAIRREQRAARRRMRTWQALAAAAVVALIALLLPLPDGAADQVLHARGAADDAAQAEGKVEVIARSWGMTVALELRGLPARDGYSLVAVTDDDHRATAASWSGTDDDFVQLVGSCYVAVERLEHMEVVTPDGEVLVVFDA